MTWHACRLFLARRDMQRATIARDLLSISCSVLSYLSKKLKQMNLYTETRLDTYLYRSKREPRKRQILCLFFFLLVL
jgi:hypothetical protein